MTTTRYVLYALLSAASLFVGMIILLEVGRCIGVRRLAKDPEGARAGFAAIEGAVFGLLGLLLAFVVSGAGGRFDARRQLVVDETNSIATAYLRLDMLPNSAQPGLREIFRRYLDTRIAAYRMLPDIAAAERELAKANNMQLEMWRQAIAAVRADGAAPQAAVVLLPALNAMFDIETTRTMAAQLHPPTILFAILFLLALVCALLAGYGMAGGKSRSWLHVLCFAFAISVTVYVILDIEFPRAGFVHIEAFDQALVDLRASMNVGK